MAARWPAGPRTRRCGCGMRPAAEHGGRASYQLQGRSWEVVSVASWSEGGRMAAGAADKTVRLWDAASGRARHKLKGHSQAVRSVAWSPDGSTVASGSEDKTVRL